MSESGQPLGSGDLILTTSEGVHYRVPVMGLTVPERKATVKVTLAPPENRCTLLTGGQVQCTGAGLLRMEPVGDGTAAGRQTPVPVLGFGG